MNPLRNSKHEQFAQGVAKGQTAKDAYIAAGYSASGADQSAARLLRNAQISGRIAELQSEIAAKLLDASIREVNGRVQALQKRWELLHQVIEERGADPTMQDVPGGKTGLLCKDFRGKDADTPVYKVDTAVLAELRAHEEQAARELGQWKTKAEVTGKDGGPIETKSALPEWLLEQLRHGSTTPSPANGDSTGT